jgi:hypothetical protein
MIGIEHRAPQRQRLRVAGIGLREVAGVLLDQAEIIQVLCDPQGIGSPLVAVDPQGVTIQGFRLHELPAQSADRRQGAERGCHRRVLRPAPPGDDPVGPYSIESARS